MELGSLATIQSLKVIMFQEQKYIELETSELNIVTAFDRYVLWYHTSFVTPLINLFQLTWTDILLLVEL